MRKTLIAGNWKMNGDQAMAQQLCSGIVDALPSIGNADVLVCPPYTLLHPVADIISGSACLLGAQDVDINANGAFTGQISATMLRDSGCQYAILGHSERRQLYGESNDLIAEKVSTIIDSGLTAILCVGETQQQRESDEAEKIINQQLQCVIEKLGIGAFKSIVVAYEPVWAIGTGLTATPEQAQQIHQFIRQEIAQLDTDIADACRILYGGSMKPENAEDLLSQPDIDGGLIGGAALNLDQFLNICKLT